MTQYNWSAITNEEFARLIRNGAVRQAYDTDFNAAFIEENARRIDADSDLSEALKALLALHDDGTHEDCDPMTCKYAAARAAIAKAEAQA